MATKQIIVLDQQTNETEVNYRIAFWFPITLNPVPQSAGSAWVPSGSSAGASTAENQAIQAGTIKEEVRSFDFPVGTPVSAIEAVLQQAWAKRNAQIAGQGANQFYGSFFDGTTWGVS
jgi:hypothetical protein